MNSVRSIHESETFKQKLGELNDSGEVGGQISSCYLARYLVLWMPNATRYLSGTATGGGTIWHSQNLLVRY